MVDADQSLEFVEDAEQMRVNELLVVAFRHHAHHVVQQHDAFWLMQRVQLGVQPADDRRGHRVQDRGDLTRAADEPHHHGRHAHQPGGHGHWPAGADHPDAQPLGVQPFVHHFVEPPHQGH